MKNITLSTVEQIKNPQSYVEYEIMDWRKDIVLKSLWNPETSEEALVFLKDKLKNINRYASYIPLNNNILYKIILNAFVNEKKIDSQLSIFYNQISSKVAKTRVELWFIIWNYANKAYKPINNVNFDQKVA